MFRQLLRILWNRRRTNGLVLAEAFVAFLVLFAVAAFTVNTVRLYLLPLGFNYENTWDIRAERSGDRQEGDGDVYRALLQTVREFDEVEQAFLLDVTPFRESMWSTTIEVNGQEQRVMMNQADDTFAEAVGLEIVRGRWFSSEDDGVDWAPVVVSQHLVNKTFPGEDPIGKFLRDEDLEHPERDRWRIVGVFSAFRQKGEFSERLPYAFQRVDMQGSLGNTSAVQIRLRPGTSRAFEEPLLAKLRSVAPGWGFSVRPWELNRSDHFRRALVPIVGACLIVFSFLLMVALGLLGVLWQTVSQRTLEFGIRRAMGASGARVRSQIRSELVILVGAGSLLGALFAVQAPLLKIHKVLTWPNTIIAMLVSAGIMAAIGWFCATYPSLLATRISPSDALHYE